MQPQQQQQQQQTLLLRWASRLAPVANLVLSDLRIGSNNGSQGHLAAKLELSSGLLVNLQLLDLCKSPATCPSAAGVYLPSGYAVPFEGRSSSPSSAVPQGPPSLSANYNAFVMAPYTSRLTSAYQSATLHRWQLLGLSRLVSDLSRAGSGNGSVAGQAQGRGASNWGQGFASSGSGQQQQGGMLSRGWVNRRLLLRRRWQRVLQLRAFVKSLDYAMFLVFHQQAHYGQQAAGDVGGMSGGGAGSTIEPGGSTPAEQYQMLYRMYVAELEATATAEQPVEPQRGWFSSRRSTRTHSIGGVAMSAAAAAASVAAAAAATAASVGSSPGAASAAAAGSLPGSPSIAMMEQGVCDWRRGHLRDTLRHRLSTAERAQSSQASPSISRDGSGASFLYASGSSGPLAGATSVSSVHSNGPFSRRPSAAPVRVRDGAHSFTGDMNGLPPVAERTTGSHPAAPPAPAAQQVAASRMAARVAAGAAATSASGAAAQSLRSDSVSSDGSNPFEVSESPMGGMQMFNALRNLRSGSSFLLGAAAQQLRLRKRQEQRLQQQQQVQQPLPQHIRPPSRLGPRPDPSIIMRGSVAAPEQQQAQAHLQQQLPQGWQASASSFAAVDAAMGASEGETVFVVREPRAHEQQQQAQQQPQGEVLLDFLSAFATFEDFLNRPVTDTADAASSRRRVLAASSRQPQLSLSYLQQPPRSQQLQRQRSNAAALGRAGRSADQAVFLDDQMTLALGHLKMVLGPHSVSMGLQLMTSLMGAATAGRPIRPTAGAGSSASGARHAKAQYSPAASAATPAGRNGSAGSSVSSSSSGTVGPRGLTMRLQLSVLHVSVNMERMAATDRVRRAGSRASRPMGQLELLETKGLLSLLLLDACSSVQRQPGTASGAAAADSAAHAGDMRVSCTVAHVGLQDLCAPLEQRHVLSGAREPYKVVGLFVVT